MNKAYQHLYKQALREMNKECWLPAINLLKHLAAAEKDWRFSWNLGWCYFKLDKLNVARTYMIRASRLAPEEPTCKWGLGNIYLKGKQFKKAEAILAESLAAKESHLTRIALALAYLSQGKISEAERVHLEGIRLKPKDSKRFESYAAFLSDVGREPEARAMNRRARELQKVN